MYFRSPIFFKSDLWKQSPNCSFHSKPFSIILQPAVNNAICHSLNGFLYNQFKVQDCYHSIQVHVCVLSCFSCAWLFLTLWTVWDSPGKNTGVGCHACSRGIFPTQGSNLPLLHGRRILYCWAAKEAQNVQVTLPKIVWFKKRLHRLGRVLCPSSTYVFVE